MKKKAKASTTRPALRPQLEAFVRHYDTNGGSGVEAYFASHKDCVTRGAAYTGASRLLKSAEIRTRLAALAEARWRRVQMPGDEALGRVALDARADPRKLFDPETGTLLPIHEWPDDVAQSVKSVRVTKDGGLVVTMNDSLAARRMILEQQGKLKNIGSGIGELARLLAGESGDDPEGGE